VDWQEVVHGGLGCSPQQLGLIQAAAAGLTFHWPESELPETQAYLAALGAVGHSCRIEPIADPVAAGSRLISARGAVSAPVVGVWGRGTGATTLAWHLATHWQASGARIGVLDLDIRHPGLFQVAAVSGKPAVIGQAIVPRVSHDVRLLGLTAFLPTNRPLIARGADLERLCRTYRDDALWRGLDLLLVDLPDLPEVAAMQAALFSVRFTLRLLGPVEPELEEAQDRQDLVCRLGADLPLDADLAAGKPRGAHYQEALSSLAERIWAQIR